MLSGGEDLAEVVTLAQLEALAYDLGLVTDLLIKISVQQTENAAALSRLENLFLEQRKNQRA